VPQAGTVQATEMQHKVLSDPLLKHTVDRLATVMRRPQAENSTQNELSFGINALGGAECCSR
jgi:hypothetical protein